MAVFCVLASQPLDYRRFVANRSKPRASVAGAPAPVARPVPLLHSEPASGADGKDYPGTGTSTSARKFRNIMTPQLSIRVLSSEVPLDGPLFGISRLLPGINFGLQKFSIGNASIQALAGEDANFDLGHIQPARMLGCVMELHAAQEFLGSARSQHIVEALSEVGIEIVQHQVNSTRLGIDASEKPVDEGYEVNLSPMGGDRDDALAPPWVRQPRTGWSFRYARTRSPAWLVGAMPWAAARGCGR